MRLAPAWASLATLFLSCSKLKYEWITGTPQGYIIWKKKPKNEKKMFDQQLFPPILLFKFFFPTLFFQVLHQHNDTLSRLEAASSSAYSYALGITVGLGGILCFLNGMLLLCLCQKRASSKRRSKLDDPTGSEYLHFA